MSSHLATLPTFPFLPPPVYPVMPDNDGLKGKEKKKKKGGMKGPVCEGTQEQAGGMDPGQPGPLLLQQAHCSHVPAPTLREKAKPNNQGARGQIKVLREGIKTRKKQEGGEGN